MEYLNYWMDDGLWRAVLAGAVQRAELSVVRNLFNTLFFSFFFFSSNLSKRLGIKLIFIDHRKRKQ